MKNNLITLLTASIFVFASITSAKAQMAKDEVQLIQSIWGMEKRAIVNEVMKFNEAEMAKFLPVYDAYMAEHKKLGEERIQIIAEYANKYPTLTNDDADKLSIRLLTNNVNVDRLQLKYYNLLKKQITPIRAAQFFQLELYLQNMMRSELQSSLPMIGELDKKAH